MWDIPLDDLLVSPIQVSDEAACCWKYQKWRIYMPLRIHRLSKTVGQKQVLDAVETHIAIGSVAMIVSMWTLYQTELWYFLEKLNK